MGAVHKGKPIQVFELLKFTLVSLLKNGTQIHEVIACLQMSYGIACMPM